MSSSARWLGLWLAAGLTTHLTVQAAAQTVAATRARITILTESLAVVQGRLHPPEVRRPPSFDTVHTGRLTVFLEQGLGTGAHDAVPLAWGRLREAYGAYADSIRGVVILARDGSDATVRAGIRVEEAVARSFWATGWRPGPSFGVPSSFVNAPYAASAVAPADTLAQLIQQTAALSLWPRSGKALREWLAGVLPVWTLPGAQRASLYTELATSPFSVARHCFEGDLAACRVALTLSLDSIAAFQWYDREDRRVLLQQLGERWYFTNRRGQVQDCVERRNYPMCDYLVRNLEPNLVRPPLTGAARQSLLAVALTQGGPEAFARLVERRDATIGEQLAHASGMPLDALLAAWRDDLLRARPDHIAVTPASGWSAFGWCLLFGLLALRSTRWR